MVGQAATSLTIKEKSVERKEHSAGLPLIEHLLREGIENKIPF